MKGYIAHDIETTCLQPRKPENIIQSAFVFENPKTTKDVPVWQLPKLVLVIDQGRYEGEPYALALNGWLLSMVDDSRNGKPTKYPVVKPEVYEKEACDFLGKFSGAFPVGANIGSFDLAFASESILKLMHYRSLEIGSFFADPLKGPKSLAQIKRELGFDGVVSHNAYHECMDYILCMRTKYNGNLTQYTKEM